MANTQKRKKKNKRKDRVLSAAIGIVTGLLLLVIAALGYSYTQITSTTIYDGVQISGIDVGGLTKFEALEKLKSSGLWNNQTFDVIMGDTVRTVSYSDVNMTSDFESTVSNAYSYGRRGGMLERCAAILGAKLNPVTFVITTSYDKTLVDGLVESLANEVVSGYRNSSYSISDNTLTVDLGNEGRAIDTAKLRAGLIENFDNGKALDITLTPAVQKPDAIDFAAIRASIKREKADAYLNNEDLLNPFVVPEVYGIDLDLSFVEKTLAGKGSGKDNAVYRIPLTITAPEITSDEVICLEPFADVLIEVTTKLNAGNKPRTTNVQIACDYVNGTILLPGEEFSYNDVVGERTYERGFKDAKIYVSGEVVDGVGGGICQVSSMLYMAALRADLEITSRRNHRFTVDYAPLGEDATVVYGQVDFKFVNNTEYPIRIECALDGSEVHMTFYGNQTMPNKEVKLETTVLEKTPFETVTQYDPELAPDETKVKNAGYTGYKTETYRVVYIDGVEVSRTKENKSTYTKLDKVILSGTDPEAPVVTPPTPENPTVTTPDNQYPDQEMPDQTINQEEVPDQITEMPEWLRPIV